MRILTMTKTINNADYFFCYNPKLSAYLYLQGLSYITKAIHPKTQQLFSLYQHSEELTTAIKKYKSEFPRK